MNFQSVMNHKPGQGREACVVQPTRNPQYATRNTQPATRHYRGAWGTRWIASRS